MKDFFYYFLNFQAIMTMTRRRHEVVHVSSNGGAQTVPVTEVFKWVDGVEAGGPIYFELFIFICHI